MELDEVQIEEALMRIYLPYGRYLQIYEWILSRIGAADINNPTFWLLSEVDVVSTRYVPAE